MEETECKWYDVPCHFGWFQDETKAMVVWASEQLFNGAIDALNAIPMPAWADNAASFAAGIPAGVWYFASIADLQFGATVIASAYTIRFLIRRIPVIG